MTYDSTMMHIDIAHNSKSDQACRFLQAMGHRFLIDFGVMNSEQIADCEYPHWDSTGPEGAD